MTMMLLQIIFVYKGFYRA